MEALLDIVDYPEQYNDVSLREAFNYGSEAFCCRNGMTSDFKRRIRPLRQRMPEFSAIFDTMLKTDLEYAVALNLYGDGVQETIQGMRVLCASYGETLSREVLDKIDVLERDLRSISQSSPRGSFWKANDIALVQIIRPDGMTENLFMRQSELPQLRPAENPEKEACHMCMVSPGVISCGNNACTCLFCVQCFATWNQNHNECIACRQPYIPLTLRQ